MNKTNLFAYTKPPDCVTHTMKRIKFNIYKLNMNIVNRYPIINYEHNLIFLLKPSLLIMLYTYNENNQFKL